MWVPSYTQVEARTGKVPNNIFGFQIMLATEKINNIFRYMVHGTAFLINSEHNPLERVVAYFYLLCMMDFQLIR